MNLNSLQAPSHVVPIEDASQIGQARRRVHTVSGALGCSTEVTGRAELVVTELATNIARHAGTGGMVVLRGLARAGRVGVEILALDQGRGLADPARGLSDGFSTGGTSGNGLGAVRRLSGEFDLFSRAGGGTAVLSRIWSGRPARSAHPRAFEMGAVCTPLGGETECGDAWSVATDGGGAKVLVADGLGHGPSAAGAARAALEVFGRNRSAEPGALMEFLHDGLRATRGAAVTIAEVDAPTGRVRSSGVGNVLALVAGPSGSRHLVGQHGTAGVGSSRVRVSEAPWSPDALLILASDGLLSRLELERHPGLSRRHPALVAGVLYRDFVRGSDDAVVLVLGHRREEPWSGS